MERPFFLFGVQPDYCFSCRNELKPSLIATHWENAVETEVRELRLEDIGAPSSKYICMSVSTL